MNWRDFWNSSHPVYVNERHKILHYEIIADNILRLIVGRSAQVLDYGCGEARAADRIAQHCGRLYLLDPAERIQDGLHRRFDNKPSITIAATLAAIPDASLDLIVVNSVVQYLSAAEFSRLLDDWSIKLKKDGRLVLADIIRPDSSQLSDVKALLAFAWHGGFLGAGLVGLVRMWVSPYRRFRFALGLAHYSPADLLSMLRRHGYRGFRAEQNLGHDQARMTFIGKKEPSVLNQNHVRRLPQQDGRSRIRGDEPIGGS
jgi:SAM-dependent methyltransferase